jgi:hypothetical protein
MIKLIDLLNEILKINNLNLGDKYISANDLSKKLEPNPKKFMILEVKFSNFGDKTIVIDAFDTPKNPNNQIHDLNQYIKLSPKILLTCHTHFIIFKIHRKLKKQWMML